MLIFQHLENGYESWILGTVCSLRDVQIKERCNLSHQEKHMQYPNGKGVGNMSVRAKSKEK